MALKIARGMTLPTDAVTQTFGIIARRGRGKTYTASVMAEEMIREALPFVVLDPLGAWWGLRSSADGKSAGLPVVILGGEHGDIPLEATGGKTVADFIVANPSHYVLDLSGFESNAAQDRFAADFAERLYRAKATARDALHLFVDEADSFAPQRTQPGQQRMLGAFEALTRRGRIRGIGVTVITQRPASLNKSVLTQVECLIALQITGPQDRAAVDEWVKQYGSVTQRTQFLASLASLDVGEAWVWSPSWLGTFERVRIRVRKTFDSGRTPGPGETAASPRTMAKVDLTALTSAMSATIEKAKAEDPALLRKEIADLKRRLSEQETIERVVEVPVLPPEVEGAIPGLLHVESALTEAAKAVKDSLILLQSAANRRNPHPPLTVVREVPPELKHARRGAVIESRSPGDITVDGVPVLKKGARRMLEVMARNHPMQVTRAQLGALTGMAHTGGTFSTYLGLLKRARYVEQMSDVLVITAAGLAESGVSYREPLTTDEVREQWRGILKAGARRMFDTLIEVYPDGLSREELGERAGIEMSGGTFGTYLGTLRRNALIEEQNGTVRAAAVVVQ